jgi:acyl carrier protein
MITSNFAPSYIAFRTKEILLGLDTVQSKLHPAQLRNDTTLDSLGVDSMGLSDLAMWLDLDLDIDMDFEALRHAQTVGDVITLAQGGTLPAYQSGSKVEDFRDVRDAIVLLLVALIVSVLIASHVPAAIRQGWAQ